MKFNAIILAAGIGSRLGKIPKSLIKINGLTLIERLINSLNQCGVNNIRVVTGYYALEVEKKSIELQAQTVFNPEYENGNHQDSLKIGLESFPELKNDEATIICLVDQPLLNASSIKKLIDYYDSQKKYKKSVYPVNSYKRGHPIIISNDFFKIALIEKVFNLKDFWKKHSTHGAEFSTEEEGFFLDVDTELDVQYLRDQHKTDLELPIK